MEIFIDCEHNGRRGQLLSIALISGDERSFYKELPMPTEEPMDDWVQDNVVPLLGRKQMVSYPELQRQLELWLVQFDKIHLIADWPEDAMYFCELLITSPGERINTPSLTIEIRRDLDAVSKVPHHALWDVMAMREVYYVVTNQESPTKFV
jgi:hypothetical protein